MSDRITSFHFLKGAFLCSSTALCLSVFPLSSCSPCTSPGAIPSTDTLSAHHGDLNREASSGDPCSHDAGLCLAGCACALIIPSEKSCLLFLFFSALGEVCLCAVDKCVFVSPDPLPAHHIFSQLSLRERSWAGGRAGGDSLRVEWVQIDTS